MLIADFCALAGDRCTDHQRSVEVIPNGNRVAVVLAFACAAIASPAGAHWQFTKWGMTPAQVIEASNGTASVGDGAKSGRGDDTVEAIGTYVAGETSFTAKFWFGHQGLSMVALQLRDDGKCLDVQRDLLAKYGEPVERTGGSGLQRRMWVDSPSGNRVGLLNTDVGFCQVEYSPLVSSTGAGL